MKVLGVQYGLVRVQMKVTERKRKGRTVEKIYLKIQGEILVNLSVLSRKE